jgi:hypothetical protein
VIKGAWGKTHWAGKKGMALFALLELLGATQYEGRKLMQSSDTPANPSK